MPEREFNQTVNEIYQKTFHTQENESKSSLTLPGLKYLQLNCISQCRQEYMAKYCNCSVEAFFPLGNFTSCDFEDLKCLYNHNGKVKTFLVRLAGNSETFFLLQTFSTTRSPQPEILSLMTTTREWNVRAYLNVIAWIMRLKSRRIFFRRSIDLQLKI